ncbi:ATP-binding protein [Noviherbaspirillum galbum]|uniref:histidine kinase n=1 Tax=Noviherbaspirillum galbum TaxID=2709383 RepID=A0A6B3SGL1_9BURK|nr:ATP-binding protein [Noviherbaspirillum galbum]NEX60004.1 PAS domain S-box protein [Noviherbaspirillum galbum]
MATSRTIPMPWDEASRLEAVRALRLLDTPPEERFDRITRIARDMFGVRMALINLVDADRQWSKSRLGLDAPEVPRIMSFCSHAILQDDIFLIQDASLDPRFADNAFVAGDPGIRFYAGKPLHSLDGKKVGTLCLLDTRPHTLTDEERGKLTSLSAWAEREVNAYISDADAARRWEYKLRLAHVLEHAIEGVLSISLDGVIETVNPAACQMFRLGAADLIGRNVRDILPQADHARHDAFMERMRLDSGPEKPLEFEVTGKRGDGELFPAEVSLRKLGSGDQVIYAGVVRDISERRHLERARSAFVSSVSHELRTPLTSVVGALGLLREEFSGLSVAETTELLEIAYLNGQRLQSLINDILDIEKLDAGMMRFSADVVQVGSLVSEACRLNLPFASKYKVRLECEGADMQGSIRVDASRINQVLTNLISNACKFSPRDAAVVVSSRVDGGMVRISVRDHGPGISDEFRSRIFQRFAQGPSDRKVKNEGTGLGLSLAKTMVEKMGGRIGFDSVAGQGATFHVSFPLVPAAAESVFTEAS